MPPLAPIDFIIPDELLTPEQHVIDALWTDAHLSFAPGISVSAEVATMREGILRQIEQEFRAQPYLWTALSVGENPRLARAEGLKLLAALREHNPAVYEHNKELSLAITDRLAQVMHIPATELPYVRRGGLFHDIGKLAVPNYLLNAGPELIMDQYQTARRELHGGAGGEMMEEFGDKKTATYVYGVHQFKPKNVVWAPSPGAERDTELSYGRRETGKLRPRHSEEVFLVPYPVYPALNRNGVELPGQLALATLDTILALKDPKRTYRQPATDEVARRIAIEEFGDWFIELAQRQQPRSRAEAIAYRNAVLDEMIASANAILFPQLEERAVGDE